MTDTLFDLPPSAPPALTIARQRVDRLQTEHDRIYAANEELGTEGELHWADEWRKLCADLRAAKANLLHEETAQAYTPITQADLAIT